MIQCNNTNNIYYLIIMIFSNNIFYNINNKYKLFCNFISI